MKQKRILLCRSQSEAMILSRRLSSCGIDSILTRPPRSKKVHACTWGLEIDQQQCESVETCLDRAKIANDVWCWEDS